MTYQTDNKALFICIGTFVFWGLMPIYWKALHMVTPYEILGHRVLWSFVFMTALVAATGRMKGLLADAAQLVKSYKRAGCLILGAILISANWGVFIWAVAIGRVVETSLGYYINPLLNVLVGVTILRERLSMWQFIAVLLAAMGVIYQTVNFGSFPWVAIFLAGSMVSYSLCKKGAGLSAISGMTLETAISAPVALFFFIKLYSGGGGYPIGPDPVFLMLIGAGVVTAVPLIMFAYCLSRLPLSVIGIVQYLAPTLTLLLGVFAYGEAFTRTHLISFTGIWSALVLFAVAKSGPMVRLERRISAFLGSRRP